VSRLVLVQHFVKSLREADTLAELSAILGEATRQFDFDYFALVQRPSARRTIGSLQLSDYPSQWVDLLAATTYYVHDPVLLACEKSVTPFSWDGIPEIISMSKHQTAYMANARAIGLEGGYTIPIHVPGTASGLCSFVTTNGRQLPAESLPAAQYLACFAFEAARRLVGRDGGNDGEAVTSIAPRLTQRQLDCVVLAARGKSNWVAGQLLGISPDTVHKYLESAKQRYCVSSRTELVVRALFDGQLSFNDVIADDFARPGQKRARPGQRRN
jgi:LuxR family transcriptional regulator, quorum-sensing system regulator CciR